MLCALIGISSIFAIELNEDNSALIWIAAAIGFLRWLEIVGVVIEVFAKQIRIRDSISSIIAFSIPTVTVVIVFAIFYRAVYRFSPHRSLNTLNSFKWYDYIFLSWKSLSSLGSGMDATYWPLQFTIICEGATGIAILAMLLSYAVGIFEHR